MAQALQALGHELRILGVGDDIDLVRRACEEERPDVCFNLLVEFQGTAHKDQHVASYLELLQVPHTGCNPRGLFLGRDKALTKTILAHEGLPVPRFAVFPRGKRARLPRGLAFPLFVKSVDEEASLGIARSSLVSDERALERRVAFVHESLGTDAIAEEYIPGRELTIGILGHTRLTVLPIWELELVRLPAGVPNIATRRVKFDPPTQRRLGLRSARARLPRPLALAIARAARAAHRALGLSGYARLDLRLAPDGRFFFLEANPNPELARGEDLADSAEAAGLRYPELIQRILDLACSRARAA